MNKIKHTIKIVIAISLFALSLHADKGHKDFPWDKENIKQVRCLMAKPGLVMLVLEFDQVLKNPIFKERKYMLLKWIPKNEIEVELNQKLRSENGVIPGIGVSIDNFNLQMLLNDWEERDLLGLVSSIQKSSGQKKGILDANLALSYKRENGATLVFMPFAPLINLEEFIEQFGASEALIERARNNLSDVFNAMLTHGIIHGDLALRNVGVVFSSPGPFANLDEALSHVSDVVLFDFGGARAGFLKKGQAMPAIETLDHVISLINKRLGFVPRERGRRREMADLPAQMPDPTTSPLITPLRLIQGREKLFGSPHKRAKKGLEFEGVENQENE